ncbi:MAG: amino acid ABC transporter permease [Pseudanabaenaceae cyanobacterium bins.68]|nr:amino acid ABC transporter permease [Pseudanabaenaceae cyanobacterium bins.68]
MLGYKWNWRVFWEEVPAGGEQYLEWLFQGLAWTLIISLGAWLIALALGTIMGIVRTLPPHSLTKPLLWLADAYVEVFRNIPLIVQMFLWFFVLPELLPSAVGQWLKQDLPLPEVATAVVSLGFYTSARIAEQVKAGIGAIPRDQTRAGLAMGLNLAQVYGYILLPQSFRLILPPLTSEAMNVVKNSSVALTIGVLELTAQARQINEYTFNGFEVFTVTTVLYVIVGLTVNRLMTLIEATTKIPGMGSYGRV